MRGRRRKERNDNEENREDSEKRGWRKGNKESGEKKKKRKERKKRGKIKERERWKKKEKMKDKVGEIIYKREWREKNEQEIITEKKRKWIKNEWQKTGKKGLLNDHRWQHGWVLRAVSEYIARLDELSGKLNQPKNKTKWNNEVSTPPTKFKIWFYWCKSINTFGLSSHPGQAIEFSAIKYIYVCITGKSHPDAVPLNTTINRCVQLHNLGKYLGHGPITLNKRRHCEFLFNIDITFLWNRVSLTLSDCNQWQ